LSVLTGFPVAYFYLPIEPGPLLGGDGRMWVCSTDGCESPEPDWVDERGVLHYGGEPPRTPPAGWQPPASPTPVDGSPPPAPGVRHNRSGTVTA
jgi:hypothetical protein